MNFEVNDIEVRYNTTNKKILTPDGYKDFRGITKILLDQKLLKVVMGEKSLVCTYGHEFVSGTETIEARDLIIGDLLYTIDGTEAVTDIIPMQEMNCVYDVFDVDGGSVFYSNGILSHNCRFLGSKDTLIEPDKLELIETKEPIDLKHGGLLRVYEKPIHGCKYVIGVDVATGSGGDYSCLQVMKIISHQHLVQVATYRHNKILIDDFAQVTVGVGDYYNKAMLVIENNLGGGVMADSVWYTYEYENVYNNDAKKIGVRATTRSKLVAVLNMRRYIENGWIEMCDAETVNELSNYGEKKRGNFGALGSKQHDDLVASLYWALYYMISEDFVNDLSDTYKQLSKIDDKYLIESDDETVHEQPIKFQFSD